MNGRFWAGVATGTLTTLGVIAAVLATATAILHDLDMAEARTWTDEDDELRMLAYDINGQHP